MGHQGCRDKYQCCSSPISFFNVIAIAIAIANKLKAADGPCCAVARVQAQPIAAAAAAPGPVT